MNKNYEWYYERVLKDNSPEDAEWMTNEFEKSIKDTTYIEDTEKLSEEYIYKRIKFCPFSMLDFEEEIEEEITECLCLLDNETEWDKERYKEAYDDLDNYFHDWVDFWVYTLIKKGKIFEIKRKLNKNCDQLLYVDIGLLKYNNLLIDKI
jgi:hypothetical protein